MPTYLQRYQDGEYEAVWAELLAFGAAIRTDPTCYQDAQAVAVETMQRVRMNLADIIAQLTTLGYVFTPFEQTYRAPPKQIAAHIQRIERTVGALPVSISAFMSVVGSVNLMGYFPQSNHHTLQWSDDTYPDPLVFEYTIGQFRAELETWEADNTDPDATDSFPFLLEFAPDEYHKQNVSGGPPYSIKLPNGAVDALVEDEWHQMTFVAYLRECLRWGGFPGLSRVYSAPNDHIQHLTRNLVPF